MAPDPGRRLLAEAIGTGLLVVFGAGALVAALKLGNGKLDYAVTLSLAVVRRFPIGGERD